MVVLKVWISLGFVGSFWWVKSLIPYLRWTVFQLLLTIDFSNFYLRVYVWSKHPFIGKYFGFPLFLQQLFYLC
jgi:hypothetical protein